jgi:segregation and condensation protein B
VREIEEAREVEEAVAPLEDAAAPVEDAMPLADDAPEEAPPEPEGAPVAEPPPRSRPDLARTIESLLFLSPQPVSVADLAEATGATEGQVAEAIELLSEDLAEGRRGIVLRLISGGFALASDPASEEAARRLLAKPRTPPLTQAQAETLAIVAYLQPVSRPEIARIRGVTSESAVQTLAERGLIEESGRSRFGAAIFKTSDLFERLFGLEGLEQLPDPSRFDPSPEDERELRERLLKAGEQRAE